MPSEWCRQNKPPHSNRLRYALLALILPVRTVSLLEHNNNNDDDDDNNNSNNNNKVFYDYKIYYISNDFNDFNAFNIDNYSSHYDKILFNNNFQNVENETYVILIITNKIRSLLH